MRKLFVRGMLSNRNLEVCYSLRKHEVRKTIRNVHTKIGNPIDIGELAFATEMNVIMSMIFGSNFVEEKCRKDGTEFRELVIKFLQVMGKPNISDFFSMLARFDLQGIQKEMAALLKSFESILEPAINEHMKMLMDKSEEIQGNGKKDFMHILLELMEQKNIGKSADLVQIKAILVDIVIGGTDTTITTVEWETRDQKGNHNNFVDEMEKHGKIGAKFRELVTKIPQVIGEPNISDFSPMLATFNLQGIKKHMEALLKLFESKLEPVVNERMKMISKGEIQGDGKKDFMQILLELMEQNDTGISVD
ncbi:hypothetical protein K7X08_013148 [Anisodus acutangulus]|uniref:Cytochrome P450 n=1 Tax=Anisodus acutangulus TaxID=402998 RepID=A0A9Q1RH37_9SOLA|nr:hypothetical protein K7X08_013148 [Anisodus acutangulus]